MVIGGKVLWTKEQKEFRSQTSSQVNARCHQRADELLQSFEGNDSKEVCVQGSCLSCLTDSCTPKEKESKEPIGNRQMRAETTQTHQQLPGAEEAELKS